VILGDSLERQLSRLNLKLKQERNRFIIILGIGHASGIKSSKLETIVHLLVLLGHILREEFLSIVKENCIIGCEDEGLGDSLKILKLWDGILISLKRLIKNLELFNFPSLKELLKRFQMLLQLIMIQRHSRIVSLNRVGRFEAGRLSRNIVEISDEVQEWLYLFACSAIQISIETNESSPPLLNICNKPNRLNLFRLVHMVLEIGKTFRAIKFLRLKIGAVLLETLV
jgi:hypothetical protein